MLRTVKSENEATPILVPYEPADFWQQFRQIIREEFQKFERSTSPPEALFQTPGLVTKPLYKIDELCKLFQVSKPTIYDWIKHGKLKPIKIRSRVFFLWQDVQQLMQ